MMKKTLYTALFLALLCTASQAQENKGTAEKSATTQFKQDPYSSTPEEKEYLKKFMQAAKDNNKEDIKKYFPLVNWKKDYMYVYTEISENVEDPQLVINLIEDFYPLSKKDYLETKAKKQKMRGYGNRFVSSAGYLGKSYYKLGQLDKAKSYLKEGLMYEFGNHAVTDLAKLYTEILIKEGKKQEALNYLEELVLHNGTKYPGVIALIESLNKEINPKMSREELISNLDKKLSKKLQDKYRPDVISKEAPLFSLKDKNGVVHSLADLKGKVVVLDFWATWCLPCIGSLPGMQAAMNKYKNDKDVVFLFIDSMEKPNSNYKEGVQEILTKNKLDIPVIFDNMDANSTADKFGIKSIPYKAIIDKKGFIRLESVGSGTDIETIVNEISAKIEIVRAL